MLLKKGKKLPRNSGEPGDNDEFRRALAAALKNELGMTHQAIKTVMRWTGASERTVKHWFAGTHGPSGHHLVAIARHSDEVLMCFLVAADRSGLSVGVHWIGIRSMLLEFIEAIDACNSS